MNRPRDPHVPASAWADTQRVPAQADLAAPATQIVPDRDAYLGQGEVGRRIAEDQVELFITGDVAGALQREFQTQRCDFITLHDIGSSGSLRLLGSLAGAATARVQRLSVRRQGHGLALAVLQFVEAQRADGSRMRVYSTNISADGAARQQMARVLLAHSRLGVLLVGDLPLNAVTTALHPLHEQMARGLWPNRELLLVPLAGNATLAQQGAQLADDTPVVVHVAPRAAKPRQVWAYIASTWNRTHAHPPAATTNAGATPTLTAAASATPNARQAAPGASSAPNTPSSADAPATGRGLPTDIAQAVPPPAVPLGEANTQPQPLTPTDPPGRPANVPANVPGNVPATPPAGAIGRPRAAAAKPSPAPTRFVPAADLPSGFAERPAPTAHRAAHAPSPLAPAVPQRVAAPGMTPAPVPPPLPLPLPLPMPLPMPLPTPMPVAMPVPGGTRWQDYADCCLGVKGVTSVCVFDTHSLQALAHAGGTPSAERLAQQGALLLAEMVDVARALGFGATRPDAAITVAGHHLLLQHVPGHPGIALHLVVLASATHLTVARVQLERVEVPQ